MSTSFEVRGVACSATRCVRLLLAATGLFHGGCSLPVRIPTPEWSAAGDAQEATLCMDALLSAQLAEGVGEGRWSYYAAVYPRAGQAHGETVVVRGRQVRVGMLLGTLGRLQRVEGISPGEPMRWLATFEFRNFTREEIESLVAAENGLQGELRKVAWANDRVVAVFDASGLQGLLQRSPLLLTDGSGDRVPPRGGRVPEWR